MKVLFVTSVLVAALLESHPRHQDAAKSLLEVANGIHSGLISTHSIAELYSVLTRLPIQPRITPSIARQVMQRDVLDLLEGISLTPADYIAVINRLAEQHLSGGIIYDALILQAADKAGAERVLTLNAKDFLRIRPEWEARVSEP